MVQAWSSSSISYETPIKAYRHFNLYQVMQTTTSSHNKILTASCASGIIKPEICAVGTVLPYITTVLKENGVKARGL
jgi:hypothetical protein